MDPLIAPALLKEGLLGAIILVLLIAVGKLFGLLMASLEKRVDEKGTVTKALEANTDALGLLSVLIKARREDRP